MTTLSVTLTDEQAEGLAALAHSQHKTPEETLADIVQAALPPRPSITPSILDILGIAETSGAPDSRLHDQIIAEEAMNPHDGEN